MDLRAVKPALNLYNRQWPLRTSSYPDPPAKFTFDEENRRGEAIDSIVSGGCILSGGTVRNSVLGRGVRVHAGAYVEDSVILDNCDIGRRAKSAGRFSIRTCAFRRMPPSATTWSTTGSALSRYGDRPGRGRRQPFRRQHLHRFRLNGADNPGCASCSRIPRLAPIVDRLHIRRGISLAHNLTPGNRCLQHRRLRRAQLNPLRRGVLFQIFLCFVRVSARCPYLSRPPTPVPVARQLCLCVPRSRARALPGSRSYPARLRRIAETAAPAYRRSQDRPSSRSYPSKTRAPAGCRARTRSRAHARRQYFRFQLRSQSEYSDCSAVIGCTL